MMKAMQVLRFIAFLWANVRATQCLCDGRWLLLAGWAAMAVFFAYRFITEAHEPKAKP